MESVRNQTFTDFEHLIIDGSSKDNTLQIAESLSKANKTKIFSEQDSGLYDAMNKGIDKACGDYLIFLNSGDAFHSDDTLEKIADAIKKMIFLGLFMDRQPLLTQIGKLSQIDI